MIKKLATLLATCLALSSCGLKNETSVSHSKSKYTYSFELNGCATGEHSFDSLEAMCDGLMDEELNDSCAVSLRDDYYFKHCE